MTDVVEADVEESTAETEVTPPPWEQLRKAREKKNLQQTDIAKELKLDLRLVKALEAGRLEELPQPVYTAGYIRAYAKLVDLPADKIVSEYASQESTSLPEITRVGEKVPARYRHVQTTLPKSFSVSHHHMSEKQKMRVLIGVLAVVVAFAIAWQITTKMTETSPAPTETTTDNAANVGMEGSQAVPESGETSVLPLSIPGQTPEQPPAATSMQTENNTISDTLKSNTSQMATILLRYNKDSWIDIRDATDKPLIRRLGKAGGSNEVTGVAPFEVLLGYSPGVSIEYNGKPFDISRYQKHPVARFTLDGTAKTKSKSKAAAGDNDKAQFYVSPD